MALLGAALGLMILSGAVEPIFDGGIVLALYAGWLAWRTPARRMHDPRSARPPDSSSVWSWPAAQLLPGAAFQAQSQRAMHSYTYFASGSMNKSLTVLGLDPLLLGGAHSFPLGFVGTFNLPEVSSYIGILPVMALVGLLARRHRRAPEAGQWWIWYVIVVVGLFLTWGGFTPVAHLVYDIPLFNRQRLLNRNLLEVDLALAVIFAIWVDRMFTPAIRPASAPAPAPQRRPAHRAPVVGHARPRTGGPAAAALVAAPVDLRRRPAPAPAGRPSSLLQLTLLVGGPWFPHLLHVPGPVTRQKLWPLDRRSHRPQRHRPGRRRGRGPPVPTGPPPARSPRRPGGGRPGRLQPRHPVHPRPPRRQLGLQPPRPTGWPPWWRREGQGPAGGLHRIGMFDPDRFYPVQSNRLGQPDLTFLRSLDSVQGYGAVVDERYDAETGTHLQLNLTPDGLSGATFAQLDLGLLVTVPQYFIHLVDRPPGFTGSIGQRRRPPSPGRPRSDGPARRHRARPHARGRLRLRLPPVPDRHLDHRCHPDPVLRHRPLRHRRHRPLPVGGVGGLRIGLLSARRPHHFVAGSVAVRLGPRPVTGHRAAPPGQWHRAPGHLGTDTHDGVTGDGGPGPGPHGRSGHLPGRRFARATS